jgi:chemotaxis protein MotB
MKNTIFLFLGLMWLSSCVTAKKYNELNALSDKYFSEKIDLENKFEKKVSELEDCLTRDEALKEEIKSLNVSMAKLSLSKDQLTKLLDEYKILNDELFASKKNLLDEANSNQKMLADKLALKEKELDAISAEQAYLDAQLKARMEELNLMEEENKAQSARIAELESRLKEKDAALQNLKTTIAQALKGFSSEEITVEEKNGSLYVSLSEKLLFSSGSFTIDTKGADAISKLGQVLKEQEDFTIVVEGHTDNVPYNGTGVIKDNWDLSAKRATSVVRILTNEGGVAPNNVSASGRGEYLPLNKNTTNEEKAINRRTEIVLSPKLDKIMNIINKE